MDFFEKTLDIEEWKEYDRIYKKQLSKHLSLNNTESIDFSVQADDTQNTIKLLSFHLDNIKNEQFSEDLNANLRYSKNSFLTFIQHPVFKLTESNKVLKENLINQYKKLTGRPSKFYNFHKTNQYIIHYNYNIDDPDITRNHLIENENAILILLKSLEKNFSVLKKMGFKIPEAILNPNKQVIIYIYDFSGNGFANKNGFLEFDTDFLNRKIHLIDALVLHEIFHLVQFEYGFTGLEMSYNWFMEGFATYMGICIHKKVTMAKRISGYFSKSDQNLFELSYTANTFIYFSIHINGLHSLNQSLVLKLLKDFEKNSSIKPQDYFKTRIGGESVFLSLLLKFSIEIEEARFTPNERFMKYFSCNPMFDNTTEPPFKPFASDIQTLNSIEINDNSSGNSLKSLQLYGLTFIKLNFKNLTTVAKIDVNFTRPHTIIYSLIWKDEFENILASEFIDTPVSKDFSISIQKNKPVKKTCQLVIVLIGISKKNPIGEAIIEWNTMSI